MKYSESVEMYLETIRKIEQENPEDQIVDITGGLKVSKPSGYSVAGALSLLRSEKLILQEPYCSIYLSSKDRILANKACNRHKQITEFLMSSQGLDGKTAAADACGIKHLI